MDYHCPVCGLDLKKRKLGQSVVARMHIDCPQCKNKIRLNIHRLEVVIVLLGFGTVLIFGEAAYWFQNQSLLVFAFVAAIAYTLAMVLLERIHLKAWPRYVSTAKTPGTERQA